MGVLLLFAVLCALVPLAAALRPGAKTRFMPEGAQPTVPSWAPVYALNRSTIFMPCNDSGWFSPSFSAQYGVADYDWSNAKQLWANQQPMDCEERLITQANLTKAANSNTRVFVYRNLVKALPWFTSVRTRLTDPAYAGWFLKFKEGGSYHVPNCTLGKCSEFYHDQDQTPQYPHGDGSCAQPCDCGSVPCGEYLWDHRNQSLRTYLIEEFIGGPTGLGNPLVDGFYLDDGWSDKPNPILPWEPKQGFCDHNPYGGPTEEDYFCVEDMGLTQQDVIDIYSNWTVTMQQVFSYILAKGAFSWQQFRGDSPPPPGNASACIRYFQGACSSESSQYTSALMYSWSANPAGGGNMPLCCIQHDITSFLLVRGPYAWLGYSWVGCSSGSEPPGAGSHPYEFPSELNTDYGTPTEVCHEAPGQPGVFQRSWTKGTVQLDCNTGETAFLPQPANE